MSEHAALLPALLGSAGFLVISGVFALMVKLAGSEQYLSGAPLLIRMRDFAVAAALANQAFGPPAAVAGVYGVLMLVAGAAASRLLHRPQ